MHNYLLFIAPYPDEHNIKEGMHQRIKAVDDLFPADERIYLDISFTKNWKLRKQRLAPKTTIFKLNFFIHLPAILYHFSRAGMVYCHSIYNFTKIAFFSGVFKKRIVLDLHGIVPEEKRAEGFWLLSTFYGWTEKLAFRSISLAVHVTVQMKDHYSRKYPKYQGDHALFAIIPAHLKQGGEPPNIVLPDLQRGSPVNIIYTGNTQIWQNIKLMLSVIKNNQYEHIKYIILTGEPETMSSMIEAAGLSNSNIELSSVSPERLENYYLKAHYGFILRDDSVINQVANPTKMIEYLKYGIIPIVKDSAIGDFAASGYEFISYQNSFADLKPAKSMKNCKIAEEIIERNNEHLFKRAVLGSRIEL